MKRTSEVAPWNIVTHDFDSEGQTTPGIHDQLGKWIHGEMRGSSKKTTGDTLNGIYLGGVWYRTDPGWLVEERLSRLLRQSCQRR